MSQKPPGQHHTLLQLCQASMDREARSCLRTLSARFIYQHLVQQDIQTCILTRPPGPLDYRLNHSFCFIDKRASIDRSWDLHDTGYPPVCPCHEFAVCFGSTSFDHLKTCAAQSIQGICSPRVYQSRIHVWLATIEFGLSACEDSSSHKNSRNFCFGMWHEASIVKS